MLYPWNTSFLQIFSPGKKEALTAQSAVRDEFTYLAVPPCLNWHTARTTHSDDNGVTGLFFSRSEVVFRKVQNKRLAA